MPYIEDNLPYKVPYLIYVDPTNLCNFKCNFCPTGNKFLLKDVKRPAGFMTMEIFDKFVGDLKKMITIDALFGNSDHHLQKFSS